MAQSQIPDASPSHMLLPRSAIEPLLQQDAELWANPVGGLRRAFVYTGLTSFGLKADLDQAGWSRGTSFRVKALWLQGEDISAAVGDVGVISNISGMPTLRLFQWAIRQSWLDQNLEVEGGQLAIDDDFLLLDSASLFIHSGFGTAQTLALNVPVPIYPLGALGLRARVKPHAQWELLLGAYDGDAGSESQNPHGIELGLGVEQGAILLVEVSWRAASTARWSAGAFSHLGRVTGFARDRRPRGLGSAYLMLEQPLARLSGSELVAFAHAALAFPVAHAIAAAYADAGLVLGGAAWSREDDELGLALGVTAFGDASAEPTSTLATPRQSAAEGVLELTYRIWPLPGVYFQPSVQWIAAPAFSRRDSWVLGCRLSLRL